MKKRLVILEVALFAGMFVCLSSAAEAKTNYRFETREEIESYVEKNFQALSADEKYDKVDHILKYEGCGEQESITIETSGSDEAYKLKTRADEYIVNLVTRLSGKETTIDQQQFNYDCLKANYDQIKADPTIDMVYVNDYLGGLEPLDDLNLDGSIAKVVAPVMIYTNQHFQNYPHWSSHIFQRTSVLDNIL